MLYSDLYADKKGRFVRIFTNSATAAIVPRIIQRRIRFCQGFTFIKP